MIVVTGGAGFIGSAVVWQLNRQGREDILIVDNLGTSEKWRNLRSLAFSEFVHKMDFLQRLARGEFENSVEAIIHLGACSSTSERDCDYLFRNNFEYSRTLARWCLDRRVRFVYASSAATYGDGSHGFDDREECLPRLAPLSPYGYSKHLFDLWASRSGALASIVGLKFFNVFGPNEYHKGDMASVCFKAFGEIHARGKVRLFKSRREGMADGEQRRDFVYVKDCAELVCWFLGNSVCGLFNAGTGRAESWNELVRSLFEAVRAEPSIEYVDMPEALCPGYQDFTKANIEKLRNAGYEKLFRELREAVGDYVGYLARGEHLKASRGD